MQGFFWKSILLLFLFLIFLYALIFEERFSYGQYDRSNLSEIPQNLLEHSPETFRAFPGIF